MTTTATIMSNVFTNREGYQKLQKFLSENQFSNCFILVDTNTQLHCLPQFLQHLDTDLSIEVVEMEAGEEHKNLDTCNEIWKVLSDLGADRKSLLINLGGGVVTDLGGFVAATFKRGITWINFPTTLLAMVDAAVGGKNGINLDGLKNQIGVIKEPALIIADTSFLKSLPAPEMRSGLAEMLKHGLIRNEKYWQQLRALDQLDLTDLDSLILESILIKEKIVAQDPTEENLRKSLNYGHTLGHAIETYFLEEPSKTKLLHGEAVAAGMIMASYISNKLLSFPEEKLEEISNTIISIFGKIDLQLIDREKIVDLLKFDKKNAGGNINFVLLKDIGEPEIDCTVPSEILSQSFDFYQGLK